MSNSVIDRYGRTVHLDVQTRLRQEARRDRQAIRQTKQSLNPIARYQQRIVSEYARRAGVTE